jgi:hypothetical protein
LNSLKIKQNPEIGHHSWDIRKHRRFCSARHHYFGVKPKRSALQFRRHRSRQYKLLKVPKRSGDNTASKSGSFKQCSHSLARLKDFQRDETGENFESKQNADFEEDVRQW